MKKMKTLKKLMLFTLLLSNIMTFTSCQGLIDAILGEETDKPTTSPTVTPQADSKVIDLSKLTADYTAKDGDILTGKLTGNYKIMVPSGLNVTIKDVEIDIPDDDSHQFAGITCGTTTASTRADNATTRGSALNGVNLFLEGVNKIKGGKGHPGIFVPKGSELVVKSNTNGSLNVGSNGQAAAIGGGLGIDCGNITLEGGIITAIGGAGSAGIGSGNGASCGLIVIIGGKITATGGAGGAGIGRGKNGSCGNIKVEATIIIAIGGSMAAGIGSGEGSESICGTITISEAADIDSSKGEGAISDIGQGDPESLSGEVVNENVIKVTGLTLDNTTMEIKLGDDPVTLTANVLPEDATDKTITWTSSDESIASVEDGVVTAKAEGYATITAKAGEESTSCIVHVIPSIVQVTSLKMDKTYLEMKLSDDPITLTASFVPENVTDKTITWSSNNESVATVKNGVVTPLASGYATITAKSGNEEATCYVYVSPFNALIALTSKSDGKKILVRTIKGYETGYNIEGIFVTDGDHSFIMSLDENFLPFNDISEDLTPDDERYDATSIIGNDYFDGEWRTNFTLSYRNFDDGTALVESIKYGWLPALGELDLIAILKVEVNALLKEVNGTILCDDIYWSSVNFSNEIAWSYIMNERKATIRYGGKDLLAVRPVKSAEGYYEVSE